MLLIRAGSCSPKTLRVGHWIFLAGVLSGIQLGSCSESFTTSQQEIKRNANSFMRALSIEGAELQPLRSYFFHEIGPPLQSLQAPLHLVDGESFELRLRSIQGLQQQIQRAILYINSADEVLSVPISTLHQDETVRVPGVFRENKILSEKPFLVGIWLVDESSNCGNSLTWLVEVTRPADRLSIHPLTLASGNHGVRAVEFDSNGLFLANARQDGIIDIWSLEDNHWLASLVGHFGDVNAVAFSPDSNLLASAGSDQTLRLWNMTTFMEVLVVGGHTHQVKSTQFSPDGTQLASGSWDQTVIVRNVPNGEIKFTIQVSGRVNQIKYTPDGSKIVTASGASFQPGKVEFWDVNTGEFLYAFADSDQWITSMAISNQGNNLALARGIGEISIHNAIDGTPLHQGISLEDEVLGLVFAPSEYMVTAVALNGRFLIWSPEDQAIMARAQLPVPLYHIAATSDGSMFALASQIQTWLVDTSQLDLQINY